MEQVKERKQCLRRATAANAGLLVYSGLIALITRNGAFVAESLHDAGDTLTHGARYAAEASGIDQDSVRFRRFLKASMLLVSGISAWTAVRLGYNLLDGVDDYNGQRWLELSSAAVIASGNVYAHQQMNGITEHSHASHVSHHHTHTDMVASVGLAGFIAADAVGLTGAAEVGGMLFASYTAVEMFPTDKKMDHF